jgi:Skp family chaperone for outer membrane proteins
VKRILSTIAAVIALAGMASAQEGVRPAGASGDASKPTLKIGYINITKVIKEFKKANVLGDRILADAQRYENELKGEQELLKAEEAKGRTLPTEQDKENHRKMLMQKNQAYQEKDYKYQKDIRSRRDDMAVEVNKDIQRIIDSIAKHMSLEMVLTCPDVGDAKEVGSLSDAMRRMTAPAVWVAWKHPGLDVTDEVIRWLNHYCPAPGGAPAAPGNGNQK